MTFQNKFGTVNFDLYKGFDFFLKKTLNFCPPCALKMTKLKPP